MSGESQRFAVRQVRESLIQKLDLVFKEAVEELGAAAMGEGAVARLTQLILVTRSLALTNLEREIEAPLLTHPPSTESSRIAFLNTFLEAFYGM